LRHPKHPRNILKAATTAPSCSITTTVRIGRAQRQHRIGGGVAKPAFESEVMFTGDAAFQERGTISFGSNGHLPPFQHGGPGVPGRECGPDAEARQP